MRLYWLGLAVALVWQAVVWPRPLPPGSLGVRTHPEGARVFRTQGELFVTTRGQSAGGLRRMPLGQTPGPLALDPKTLPQTLEFELPGYKTLARPFPAGSFPSDRLVYPEVLQLEPRLAGIGALYWLRDYPAVPLLALLGTSFALRRRRLRAEKSTDEAMLLRHRQGDFRPGDRVAEWTLVRRLGAGGAGQVFEATSGARRVALKLLFGELQRDRFQAEVKAWKDLADPSIVFLEGWGEWQGQAYLALEFVAGETLQEKLDREGRLDPAETRQIGLQVVAALAAVHRAGLIHRDLKPANLLLGARVRLSDFGLASVAGSAGSMAGTTGYLAPEGFEGETGYPADVYALGVVLFLCLTGRLPFAGGSPLETMQLQRQGAVQAPPGWELIQAMLAPDPQRRPSLETVRNFLNQGP